MQCRQQQAGSGVCTAPICLCLEKLRKTSPHHMMSQPLLSSSRDFPLWDCHINLFCELSSVSLHPVSLRNLLFSLSLSPPGFLNSPSVCLWLYLQTFLSIYLSPFLLLLLLCFFLGAISDPFLSSLLPPCDCSHFLTLPRTRHTQPVDDPQKDPR